jgi:hypothetical protein
VVQAGHGEIRAVEEIRRGVGSDQAEELVADLRLEVATGLLAEVLEIAREVGPILRS